MKKSDLQFGAMLVPLDYVMIIAAGLAAYAIRFSETYIKYVKEATVIIAFPDYVKLVLAIGLIWLLIFAFAGLYNLRTYRKIWDEVAKVIMACSTGILTIVIFIFLNRELFASRFIVLAAWVLAVIFVSIARLVAREIQRVYLSKGKGVHNIILVGANETAKIILEEFNKHPGYGLRVVHTFSDFKKDKLTLLGEIVEKDSIDEILLADPDLAREDRYNMLDAIALYNLDFKYAADMIGLTRTSSESTTIAGIPVIQVKKTPLEGWGRIGKRIFDIVASIFLIALTSPIMIIAALAIKIDSPGPVFYLDYRTGKRGKKFLFYKFRSMKAELCDGEGPSATKEGNAMLEQLKTSQKDNARKDAILHKIVDDPRFTRVGMFIRRWSIDELPQFFNVLRGNMSLVGPRPHMTMQTANYEKHHKRLLDIKPGITGMAQVSGRSDLSFEEEVRLDVYYIENWSLWLDIKLLLQTPRAVLSSRKAQ